MHCCVLCVFSTMQFLSGQPAVTYGAKPYGQVAASSIAALDAADGVMDGKYFGAQIVAEGVALAVQRKPQASVFMTCNRQTQTLEDAGLPPRNYGLTILSRFSQLSLARRLGCLAAA